MKNLRRYITSLLPVLLLLTYLAGNTSAALLDVGPVVPEFSPSTPPQHGYPLWYRDTNRVPIELCISRAVSLDPAAGGGYMCNLLPGAAFDPAQEIVFPTNFPDEAFWWAGDAVIRNGNIRALLVMAVEGAWATGAITPGKQIAFNRIRFMVDTPVAGTYRIIFPYGERTFYNVPAGVHAIFHTEDIGVAVGKFDGALKGVVGPFLSWDSGVPITVGTEQFVGDPNIEHAVTGSPFGTNYFRIEGPAGSNLDGLGNNFVQTNLFAITGKLLQQPIPTPLKGDRATYAREKTSAQVSVFSTTEPMSNAKNPLAPFPASYSLLGILSALQTSGAPVPTTDMTTNSAADGKFFSASGLFADPGVIPATVTLTNTADTPPTSITVPLVDQVTVSGALFQPLNNSLVITAASSDKVAPPVLQAFMPGMAAPLGTLVGGTLTVAFPVTDTLFPANTFVIPPMTVTVRSAIGGEGSAPVTISSKAPPVANNDAANLASALGASVAIDVLANDTVTAPAAIAPATLTVVTQPLHGTASVTAGMITYTLTQPTFTGADTFTYTVNDTLGAISNAATVTVTVNNPPVAVNDAASTLEDTAVTFSVTANDTDVDLNLAVNTVVIGTLPLNGTAVADPTTGLVTYTPNLNFNGADSFTYTVKDTNAAISNIATASISINAVVDPPLAANDAATTLEDTAITFSVTANDTHPDIVSTVTANTVVIGTLPLNGTAVADPTTGLVTYTPNLNFNGADSFTYTVKDNLLAISNVATVTMTVTPVNDIPAAVNDAATTPEDTAITFSVIANDTDPDANLAANTVAIVIAPANGALVVNPDGTVTYTPNLNFNGSDSFTYTVKDTAAATSNIATANITITPVVDPPVAVNDAATTAEDTLVTFSVTANDVGIDGTVVANSVLIVTPPAHGIAAANPVTGAVTYTPAALFNGADTFTYTVKDTLGATSNVATVSITVTGVNNPPVAVNDTATTLENTPVTFSVTANDTDVDGNLAVNSVLIGTLPANGTLVVNADGTVTYTPALNFNGIVSFIYTVKDTLGAGSGIASATITVTAVVSPPVANNDPATTAEDTPATFSITANDLGIDGTVVVTSVLFGTLPANGTVVDKLDGTVTYTPALNFSGTDSFTYTVKDSLGTTSNVATVTVTVTPANDPPVAVNDVAVATANTARIINVIANDTDIDGTINPASVVIVTPTVNGTTTLNPDGTVTYRPNLNFIGIDTFTYNVSDNGGATSSIPATVSVSVSSAVTETVNVQRAQYQAAKKQWAVQGTTTNSAAGRIITVRIGTDLTGPVVGTTTVGGGGKWKFQLKGNATTPVPGLIRAISVQSSGGGARLAFPLAVR